MDYANFDLSQERKEISKDWVKDATGGSWLGTEYMLSIYYNKTKVTVETVKQGII